MNLNIQASVVQATLASAVAYGLNAAKVTAVSNPAVGAVALATLAVKASSEFVNTQLRKVDFLCANSDERALFTKEQAEAHNAKLPEGHDGVEEGAPIPGKFEPNRDKFGMVGHVVAFVASAVFAFAILTVAAKAVPAAAVSSALYAAGGIALGKAAMDFAAGYAPDSAKAWIA